MNLEQARHRVTSNRAIELIRADRNPNHNASQSHQRRRGVVYSGVVAINAVSLGRNGATGQHELQADDGSIYPGEAIGRGGLQDGRSLNATLLDGTKGWAVY